MINLLRRMLLKHVNLSLLCTFMRKKGLRNNLKLFLKKMHIIKRKSELKKKNTFIKLLIKLTQLTKSKNEKMKNNLINILKYYKMSHNKDKTLYTYLNKWKKNISLVKEKMTKCINKVTLN